MSNVENFKASFDEMARPNRFAIWGFDLLGNASQAIPYMAKGGSLPSATLSPAEAWYAGRAVKLAGDRQYPDWNLTVYQDIHSEVYDAFQLWQETTLEHEDNVGSNFHGTYKRDGFVAQLDRSGGFIAGYRIVGAILTELGAIELAADSNDVPAEFPITLAYDYHEPIAAGLYKDKIGIQLPTNISGYNLT